MVELFNNTDNKEMVFNFNAQGIDPTKVEVKMLMLMKEGTAKNLFFMGDMLDGKVRFTLPALNELSEAQQGQLRLEVIADGEYFKPWESDFQIKTKRSFQVDAVQESISPAAKKVTMAMEEIAPVESVVKQVIAEVVSESVVTKPVVAPKAKKPLPAGTLVTAPVVEQVAPAEPVAAVEAPVEPTPTAVVEAAQVSEEKPMTFSEFMKKNNF